MQMCCIEQNNEDKGVPIMYHCCKKKSVGFTLVELLVVISIIALLLSILMPTLKKARDQAKSILCMSRIKQSLFGIQMYASDNEDWTPADEAWSYALVEGGYSVDDYTDPRIFRCPSWSPFDKADVMSPFFRTFGMRRIIKHLQPWPAYPLYRHRLTSDVRNASQYVLLADTISFLPNPIYDGGQIFYFYGDTGAYANQIHCRHANKKKAHVGRADFSIGILGATELRESYSCPFVYVEGIRD